jgi:hypothetical protein
MDRFIARENIKHFRERLESQSDPDARSQLKKLLVGEEDKLAKDLELLASVDRHIADCSHRIDKQRILIATMERVNHSSLQEAKVLLESLIESQVLHTEYRQRTLIEITRNCV